MSANYEKGVGRDIELILFIIVSIFFGWLFLLELFSLTFPLYKFNPLTLRSDYHLTSPYNFQTFSSKTGNENTQTYQGEVFTLIKHQILVTHLQGNANAKPISTCNKQSKAKAVECMEV